MEGDLFTRMPDLAVWICDGGYVLKSVSVSPIEGGEGIVSVRVNERVTSSEDVLLALIKRHLAEDAKDRAALDRMGEPE